jgi:hypothetical protein
VHPDIDDVVMSALERDPRRRWPSAASMRDRIRAVGSRLGDPADDRRVVEWVDWAFEQKQRRAVQLTPMMPIPAFAPSPAAARPPPVPARLPPAPRRSHALVVLVIALIAIAAGAVAWFWRMKH